MEKYGLILSFTDQSSSFTHGFEVGQIWQKLSNGEVPTGQAHSANKAQLEAIAKNKGLLIVITEIVGFPEWILYEFKRRPLTLVKEEPT